MENVFFVEQNETIYCLHSFLSFFLCIELERCINIDEIFRDIIKKKRFEIILFIYFNRYQIKNSY
jgi:hypothetical protein